MKLKPINKKGQFNVYNAPMLALSVGLIFLTMATVAYISEKYGDSIADANLAAGCNASDKWACGTAYNVTRDLQTEIGNNTSTAGIVLTISLVGIVLTTLVGIFYAFRMRQ